MDPEDPASPAQLRQGMLVAEQQPSGTVGQVCEGCGDNWVEAGAIDDTTGEPIAGIGYRIYDLASGDMVASGTLNDQGESPRHPLAMPITQLYVIYGTEEAMDAAEAQIGEVQRERELEANAVEDWRGIPAGLDQDGFNSAYDQIAREAGQYEKPSVGFFQGAGYGANMLWDYVSSGFDSDHMLNQLYLDDRRRNFDQYELATNARRASDAESFFGGGGQGLTFGFGEEGMARLDSLFSDRSYEELVAERRQLMNAERIANPNWYVGGEVAGMVPTMFVPVGGAAANAARAGNGLRGAVVAGARTGAATGALSGAGHDEGGVIDRLDGAAIGGITGGMAGAVLSGAGVLIARGVSRTRIWGRITGNPRPGTLTNREAREWYLNQERLIPGQLEADAPLEAQARQAFQLRNAARTQARDLMADRNLAAQLARDNPNLTWDQIYSRTVDKGFTGDDIFREIIGSSQRSRPSVNRSLGLE
ncbi:Hemagglutinin-related protein [Sulfitobacter noctilucae]|uniref:hypothetical protein n=1 Tax=Sulfitobacter noctilucae TaxID=1342302 RepID=UPI000469A986|nr:hypothetical protein [Sulfitobacter noctilucae]KIN70519.1 Hemagglutinin-related protein [Sulfitobacter noctilucae]